MQLKNYKMIKIKQRLKGFEIRKVLLMMLFFYLPFNNKITSILTIFLFIYSFFDKNSEKSGLFKNKLVLGTLLLFFLHVVGLLYTSNFKYAGLDLEIKLPLLFLPIIFYFYRSWINLINISKSFVLGCLISTIIMLINSFYIYLITGEIRAFFYDNLALFMHTSYFSLYLCFCVILLMQYLERFNNQKSLFTNRILVILIIYFSFFILLLSSRSGMLILILIYVVYIFYLLMKWRWKYLIFWILSFGISSFFIYDFSAVALGRLESIKTQEYVNGEILQHDKNNKFGALNLTKPLDRINQQDERLTLIEISVYVIKKNFFLGVGTGDVKDELIKGYKYYNFQAGFQKQYNCHNQYLQFFVAFGFVGFFVFIFSIWFVYLSRLKNNWTNLFFLLILSLSFLFESILETKSGVEFFALFSSVFMAITINKKSKSSISLFLK